MPAPSSTSNSRPTHHRGWRTRWIILFSLSVLALVEMAVIHHGTPWSDLPARLEEFDRDRTRPPNHRPGIVILGTCLAGTLKPEFLEPGLGGGTKVHNLSHGDTFALNWYLLAVNRVLKGPGDRIVLLAHNPNDLLTPVHGIEGETGVLELATWSDMPLVLKMASGPQGSPLHLLLGKTWRTYRYRHVLARALWRGLGLGNAPPRRASGGLSAAGGLAEASGARVVFSPEELAAETRATAEREARALRCLKLLLAAAQEDRTQVWFVPLPVRDPLKEVTEAHVRQAIAPLGARTLDVRAQARMVPGDFCDDRHMTLQGSRKFCRVLAQSLRQQIRLGSAGAARP